jgi:hypothetical protein
MFYEEDANDVLLQKVFPKCKYTDFRRALCLLDPYSFSVDWKVIEMAGQMKSIEMFFNFMIMDINMNVLLRNPDRVPPITGSTHGLSMGRSLLARCGTVRVYIAGLRRDAKSARA